MNIVYFCKKLTGTDSGFDKYWDNATDNKIVEIRNDFGKRGIVLGSMCERKVGQYIIKRKQEKKEEVRKRIIESLSILPPWIALILAALSLIVSFVALNIKTTS